MGIGGGELSHRHGEGSAPTEMARLLDAGYSLTLWPAIAPTQWLLSWSPY